MLRLYLIVFVNYRGIFTKYIRSNVSLIQPVHKPKSRKLIKIINVLGQQSILQSNQVLLYLYDDGFVRKLIHVK